MANSRLFRAAAILSFVAAGLWILRMLLIGIRSDRVSVALVLITAGVLWIVAARRARERGR